MEVPEPQAGRVPALRNAFAGDFGMTPAEMPSDPDLWPRDPFALLGIASSAGADDARRAYTRLVKRYRPDESPREFQQIRAAYEEATRRIERRAAGGRAAGVDFPWELFGEIREPDRRSGSRPPEATDRDSDREAGRGPRSVPEYCDPTESDLPEIDPPAPQTPDVAVPGSRKRRLADAWRAARDGRIDEARAQLVTLRDERPADPEPWLRLYWLQALAAELVPPRAPGEWLVDGLLATGLSERLLVAYCDELRRFPALARDARGPALFEVPAPVARLEIIADARWRAAATANTWDVVSSDLDRLRDRLRIDEPDAWLWFVFRAIDHAAWIADAGASELLERCKQELNDCRDRELALAADFDRNARLLEMARRKNFIGNAGFDHEIRRIVRASWTRPLVEVRPLLRSLACEWIEDPASALGRVTQLADHAAVAFESVWQAVREWPVPQDHAASAWRLQKVEPLVVRFLAAIRGEDYERWRDELARFCIRELVWPQEIVHHLRDDSPVPRGVEYSERILADVALDCVCRACLTLLAECG